MRARLASLASVFSIACTIASAASAHAAAQSVTVFLDRDGGRMPASDDTPAAVIPPFGGGDRVWGQVVTCVRRQFAPFRVTVVDKDPATGSYITALVGGTAALLGYNDDSTNGVGPYTGDVEPDAIVNVFSQVGTGEADVENLCAVAAHEVGHALGLDHSFTCGDIMSYYGDECGARTFRDVDAPCGEEAARNCENGNATQNSFRQLAAAVGLRDGIALAPKPELAKPNPPFDDDSVSGDVAVPNAAANDDGDGNDGNDGNDDADDDTDDSDDAATAPAPAQTETRVDSSVRVQIWRRY